MAITKETIFTIADELDAAGEKPTLAAVRKRVGGGSYTTISAAMTEWHARRAVTAAPKVEAVPERVVIAANEFGAQVWAAASDLANARLQQEGEALEAERRAFEEAKVEAAAFADQLSAELDAATRKLDEQTQEHARVLAEKTAEVERLARAYETEHARAERAEGVAEERAKHIETLTAELDKVRSDRDAEIARLTDVKTATTDRAARGG